MRYASLSAVAVLAVVLALSSAQSAFAIKVSLDPICGAREDLLGPRFVVTEFVGNVQIVVSPEMSGLYECGWGTTEIPCGFDRPVDRSFTVTVTDDLGSASAMYTVDCPPVGGAVVPANVFALAAPWFAVIGVVGCIGIMVVFVKKHR